MNVAAHPVGSALLAAEFYRNRDVQQRMREDCGAIGDGPLTAAYVTGLSPSITPLPSWEHCVALPPQDLAQLWSAGSDIARSLWDRESLIFLIDLDYQNPDWPLEPYDCAADVFAALEPTYQAVQSILRRHGLGAMAVMTGRGYHFVGRVPLTSPVVGRLARLARKVPAWFESLATRRPPAITSPMTAEQATAAAGLGQVMEFVAHQVLAEAQPGSALPVVLNGTMVGQGAHGRASVSFDFSYAGDPLDVRQFRVLFGAYQWHQLRPDLFGREAAGRPVIATVPRGSGELARELESGRTMIAGARRARTPSPMPDVGAGVASLVDGYESSALARFHADFARRRAAFTGPVPPLDGAVLPPCVLAPFERPNDLLLKPEYIQHVVRVLMARGWHPVAIAARVEQAYTEDHHWGDRWRWMDRRTRADFDVRVFAGLVATGHDTLIDLNCVSAQEKGICAWVPCTADLRDERARLVDKERLR